MRGARLSARIEAIETTLMVQTGALASAKEQAEAHREELTQLMKNLHETVVHMGSLQTKVEERPAVRVPPGFQGAELHQALGLVRIDEASVATRHGFGETAKSRPYCL